MAMLNKGRSYMDVSIKYTVKQADGYLAIARFIFSQSHRPYIKGLVKTSPVVVKEMSKAIEADLKREYLNFKLTRGQVLMLHADPGHYIKRLVNPTDQVTKHVQAAKKATVKVTNTKDNYFVIHSTACNFTDKQLAELVSSKKKGAAHAYISKTGELYKIWPYNNPKGWATKAEFPENKPELRGKLAHIELVYTKDEAPTEAQYQTLADVYIETKETFNKWLPITTHREIDRGIRGGHQDPVRFKFEHFYTILRSKGVNIDTIERQSQSRFNQLPHCEHKWVWPPVLRGNHFPKVTASVYKTKCL